MKLLTIILCLSSFSAFAAKSDKLILKGKVPELMSIEVTEEATARTLALDVDQTNLLVAKVREISNSASGYNVMIDSLNNGTLVREGGTEAFTYTMKYDGTLVDLTSSTPLVRSSTATAVNSSNPVKISYRGIPNEEMVAGVYTDTITFTIAAN